MMDIAFIFPVGERAETVAALDRHVPQRGTEWCMDGVAISVADEQDDALFSDWEPEDIEALDTALGYHPTWAVWVDIFSRIEGAVTIRRLAALLLERGGVAMDDYSDHPWTLDEIESRAVIDGLRFFDYRTYYEIHHKS